MDIISGDVVMCLQCSDSLKKAYTFKDVCLKTEEKIYDYLQKFNISLGTQISLSDVVNYKLMGNHFSLIKTDQKDDLVTENCLNRFVHQGICYFSCRIFYYKVVTKMVQ